MKSLLLLLVPLVLVSCTSADFVCGKIIKAKLQNTNEALTCFMEMLLPSKPKPRLPISLYNTAVGVTMQGNRNVAELPERVSKAMVNLESYDASSCTITAIKKNNFVGLKKLKRVWLNDNAIDTVSSDTFDDNPLLEEIALGNNKLKIFNGQVFQNLRNLQKVSLTGNPCINTNFDTPTKIQELPQTVSRLCKFCEAPDTTIKATLTDCQSNLLVTSGKLQKCLAALETPATTTRPAVTSSAVHDFCKIQLETQSRTHEQLNSVYRTQIEDLRQEKLKLDIENEKNRKIIANLKEQNLVQRQNCETAGSEFSDFKQ